MKTPEFWRVDVHIFEKILNSYNLLTWKVFDHTHSQSLYLAGRLMDFAGNIYGFFFVNVNDFSLLYELYWECNSKPFYTSVSVCILAVVFLYISKGADKENLFNDLEIFLLLIISLHSCGLNVWLGGDSFNRNMMLVTLGSRENLLFSCCEI